MPSIKVVTGPSADAVFEVGNGTTLGRDGSADITIAAPGVSRRHVQFLVDGEEVFVQDLNSVNGTFVNGSRITKQRLKDGDTIHLSEVCLRFSNSGTTARHQRQRVRLTSPPTEPVNTDRVRELLLEQEQTEAEAAGASAPGAEEQGQEEAYSVDVAGQFSTTAIDLRLAPADQLVALQKRLKHMFEISQALAAAKTRDELFAKILGSLFEVYPQADRGTIYLGPSVDRLEPAVVRERGQGSGRQGSGSTSGSTGGSTGGSTSGSTGGSKGGAGSGVGRGLRGTGAVSRTIARKVFERKKAILCHDAREDSRFADAQSIANLRLSAFMVAPLLYGEEEVFGFLQLQGTKQFSRDDLDLLAALASSAALFLKNVQLFESVAREVKEREAIHSELRIASRIQTQLLPKADPSLSWLELSGRMKTAKEVGGDYFDYLTGPNGELYVVIGDVAGKGVPAGLVMVMARSILHSLVARSGGGDPRTIAVETNRLLKKDLKPGMFLSLLIGRCDDARGAIRFAGCGHERPLVYRAARKQVEQLDLRGTVLGVLPDITGHVAEAEVTLGPGDHVLLFTDGVNEAMDPAGQQYSVARLTRMLAEYGKLAPAELIRAIDTDLSLHARGADQHDDITMIALRRR